MSQATEQIARQFANGSVNRVIWGDLIYNVKVYGAKGDGVADDTAAIQTAIAAITSTGVLFFPSGTYKVTSTIKIDPAKHSILSYGATLDASKMTSGFVLDVFPTTDPPYGNATTRIEGLKFKGPGSTSLVDCINLGSTNDASTSHIGFRAIAVSEFRRGVTFGDHSYAHNFENCDFWNCGTILYEPAGTFDTGERESFRGCSFFNSDLVLNCDNPNADWFFHQCSMDYCFRMMTLNRGRVIISQCHIESGNTTDSANFTLTGDGCMLSIVDSWILSTTGQGPYAFFDVGNVSNGGLFIDNCFINNLPTTRIATGTGNINITNIKNYTNDKLYIPADRMSYLADPSFEGSAALSQLTVSKSGTSTVAVDATTGNTGTKSIKMNKVAAADACEVAIVVPINHGQRAFVEFYSKWSNVVQGAASWESFFLGVSYLDAFQNVLGSGEEYRTGTQASFTAIRVAYFFQNPAPKGTRYVKLRIGLVGGSTGTVWIDDLYINVC